MLRQTLKFKRGCGTLALDSSVSNNNVATFIPVLWETQTRLSEFSVASAVTNIYFI